MPVNFPTPNLLNQTPTEPSPAGTTEPTKASPLQGFSKILSQRTQSNAAGLDEQLPLVVTGEFPFSDVATDLFPGLDGATQAASQQLTGSATELVESFGDGGDTAQSMLGVAAETPQSGPSIAIGIHSYPLASGDVDSTAEQNAAGLVPAYGKNLPSLVSISGVGPEGSVGMGGARPPQQGVLQGDPNTSESLSANPVAGNSADSLQSVAQAVSGAAGGAMSQTDNIDVQALNARPAAENVGAATAIVNDGGKPLIAPAPDAARQSSWLLEQPVQSRNWEEGFGDRILWLVNNRQSVAELRLTPPHLGTLDVRITVQGDQAQVAFQVPGGAVRDAVEAALPRLREMFAEAGINLSDVGVSDHPSQQGSNAEAESDSDQSGVQTPDTEAITESGLVEVTTIRDTGQLDLFV